MSSSFVTLNGKGFEAADGALEVWLAFVIQRIEELETRPDWLSAVREDWHEQITSGFGFGIVPDLDRYMITEERCSLMIDVMRDAEERLRVYGATIPAGVLNALKTGGDGALFTTDVCSEQFLRTARYFIKLLRGTLLQHESDARFPSEVCP